MPAITLPLCVRTDSEDAHSRAALLKDGWREIELLELWVRSPGPLEVKWDGVVEMASKRAKPQCMWIASTSFTHDRLHKDPTFPDAVADREKMEFVEAAFSEADKSVLIARMGKNVVGFCIITADQEYCVIDLIGVDRRHRQKGIGRALLSRAAETYPEISLLAGTQATNRSSQALYASCGFEHCQTHRTFHK